MVPDWTSFRQTVLAAVREFPSVEHPNDLPHRSGIYFVCTPSGGVLLIGSSVDLRQRWGSHQYRHSVLNHLYTLRWKLVDEENFLNRKHEEAAWIALVRPAANIR